MIRHVLLLSALIAFLLCVAMPQSAQAQGRPPLKDYIAPDELISISSETPLVTALDIFKSAFRRFENKILVVENATTEPIKVNITKMYWKDAFEVVLRMNNFWYQATPDYIRAFPIPKDGKTEGGHPSMEDAVETREVEISAIFFEANRTELERVGLDWQLSGLGLGGTWESQTTNFGSKDFGGAGASGSGGEEGEETTEEIDYGLKSTLSTSAGGVGVLAVLQAIESENLGELISRPSITVRSEETGKIQVGADISIRQKDFSGNTVEKFFSTGTIINVTPKVMKVDDIEFVHLLISAERSTFVPDPNTTIINKTLAETSVILMDEEETVVGGLFSNDYTTLRRGVPFLKDLPWWVFGLRYIFGYNENQVVRKELIIILKAKILPSLENRLASKINEIKQGQKSLQHESERIKKLRRDLLNQIETAKKNNAATVVKEEEEANR